MGSLPEVFRMHSRTFYEFRARWREGSGDVQGRERLHLVQIALETIVPLNCAP
jgi:hypothetical protein